MNIDKALQAQTATARKVYAAVPEGEPCSIHGIESAMMEKNGVRPGHAVIVACINQLRGAKLVKEVNPGHYRRVAKRAYTKSAKPTKPVQETSMSKPQIAVVPPVAPIAPALTLSERARSLSTSLMDIAQMAEELANDLKAAENTTSEAEAKLATLRNLLKEV